MQRPVPEYPIPEFLFRYVNYRGVARIVTVAVNQTVHRRNEEQRRNRGKDQPADYRTAQRRVLFAALAESKGHRQHADDHGHGGHDNRTEAREARFFRGLQWLEAFLHALFGKAHD